MKLAGENLRRIREEKRLSRRELSELSGISQSYIVKIEEGTKNPTLEVLISLANALNVKVEYLTEDENSDEVKTFGTELDKLCSEMGIDTSVLDEDDLELITGKIMVLLKKLSKEKNAE
ncbi:helix-turn-helix transcriptional regulator [Clostridium sp.]|uniref:helix-turn-helix domain-containing protein n=1 Tax=Clostridium sp. TaxID=1506 RepID=UPI002A87F1AD|nr:helix-turn-helix transcriptional regulator [Clostridium sp.]